MLADSLLQWYVEQIARLLGRLEIRSGPLGLSLRLKEEAQRSADERIVLLDAARANLAQGIEAINELRIEAERNKKEIEVAALRLAQIEQDKQSLEHQRDEVKRLVTADITTFQQLAGVPSPTAIRRERLIGFASGVIASILASGIVWLIAKLLERIS